MYNASYNTETLGNTTMSETQMYQKECRICCTPFMAKTERRQLCDKCQKDSAKAQEQLNNAVVSNKRRLGELPSQQYHECTCLNCGKVFQHYGYKAKYCNNECNREHSASNATCRNCGVKLLPLGIVAVSGSGLCSDTCAEDYKLKEAKRKGKAAVCLMCKKEFAKKKEWDECCSRACEEALKWKTARSEGRIGICAACKKEFIKKNASDKICSTTKCYDTWRKETNKPVDVNCEVCGAEFQKHPNSMQVTCGKECSEVRRKKKVVEARQLKREQAEKEKEREKEIQIQGKEALGKEEQGGCGRGRGCVAGSTAGIKEYADDRERRELKESREKRVKMAMSGKLSDGETKDMHLCTGCRTLQSECIKFTSGHVYHPKGAMMRLVNGHGVVLTCPQYKL